MDFKNSVQTQRVWSRVQGRETVAQDTASIAALYMAEQQSAMRYLRLSKIMGGTAAEKLYTLYRQEQAAAGALRGMYILLAEKKPEPPCFVPSEGAGLPVLRRCYVEELRRCAEYESRSGDVEYGMVFSSLAEKKKQHCCMVLEIIGTLENVGKRYV